MPPTAPIPVLQSVTTDGSSVALAARAAEQTAALARAERLVPGISRALGSVELQVTVARSTWSLVMLRWAARPSIDPRLVEAFDAETRRLLALLPDLDSEEAMPLVAAGGSDLAVAVAQRCVGEGYEKLLRSVEADMCEAHDAVLGEYLEGRWSA